MSQLNEEQLRALMGMGDIGGAEDEQKRMMALATGLRGQMSGIRGDDAGSNIGRAGFGVASAMKDYGAAKAAPGLTASRQAIMAKLLAAYGSQKPAPVEDRIIPREEGEYGVP